MFLCCFSFCVLVSGKGGFEGWRIIKGATTPFIFIYPPPLSVSLHLSLAPSQPRKEQAKEREGERERGGERDREDGESERESKVGWSLKKSLIKSG